MNWIKSRIRKGCHIHLLLFTYLRVQLCMKYCVNSVGESMIILFGTNFTVSMSKRSRIIWMLQTLNVAYADEESKLLEFNLSVKWEVMKKVGAVELLAVGLI